ncbi:acyltransferase [Salinisphaera sp. SPP-AMP-43]|uniref:acyltransferase family protein n=1 Tax=Salinisphaera sp. SPP-AMP-43 TaxID=3121288 RepID=UPI003C6DD95A
MNSKERFKPRGQTFYGVEMFRGIAALMVVFYHISRHFEQNFGVMPFSKATGFGHAGVDFFFVLSGFIILFIHRSDIGQPSHVLNYIKKRTARIYPFYWFMVVITMVLIPFVSSASFPGVENLLKQFVLWPQGMNNLIIGVSWTLEFEVLFYLLFALLILNRWVGTPVLFVWLAAVVANNYLGLLHIESPVILSAFNIEFFMGMVCAYLLSLFELKYGFYILLAGVLAFGAVAYSEVSGLIDGYGAMARIYYGVASMLLITGMVSWERQGTVYIPRLGKLLGRSSFSIYLSHLFFAGIVYKALAVAGVLAILPYYVGALLVISLVLGLAVLCSVCIELPLTRKTRNILLRA